MNFNYDVTISRSINIDFQDIFDYIKSEDPDAQIESIYYDFLDNTSMYLRSIYKCEDLDEDTNEYEITDLTEKWEYWLNEIFGENWDEV
jgi:hypothetical protein